jgi:protein phosphatase
VRKWQQLSPSSTFTLSMGQAYGSTDVGLVRSSNQDNFLIDSKLGLIMIGDGMGGHDAGEIASAEALLAVRDFIRNLDTHSAQGAIEARIVPFDAAPSYDPDATWSDPTMPALIFLFEAVDFANAQVYAKNLAETNGNGQGMGTTLTGIWQANPGGPLLVFHVGDCRLYRYREGELTLLTRDQTLYQQALDEGLEPLPQRNLLLQAIGPSPEVRPEVKPHTVQADDLYLLCSDGLHGSVPHGMIASLLAKADVKHLDQCCLELIAAAKEYESRDNITAVLLAC